MLPYWIIFIAWALVAITYQNKERLSPDFFLSNDLSRRLSLPIVILGIATTLFIGLRYEVGGDWVSYEEAYYQAQLLGLRSIVEYKDIAYGLIMYMSSEVSGGTLAVNLICGFITVSGLLIFAIRQPNPYLCVLVAIPYFIIVIGMGYTRQAAAISITLLALANPVRGKVNRQIIIIAIAALFHKSAVIMLPIIFYPYMKNNKLYALLGLFATFILYLLFIRGSTDALVQSYVDADYQSSGAATRATMNIIPALILLAYRKRFFNSIFEADIWKAISILSVVALPLTLLVSFTTAIDRVGLFLIPIQLLTFSRAPYVFAKSKRANPQILLSVILYSAVVQLVWLKFASHAESWVPYKAYGFI